MPHQSISTPTFSDYTSPDRVNDHHMDTEFHYEARVASFQDHAFGNTLWPPECPSPMDMEGAGLTLSKSSAQIRCGFSCFLAPRSTHVSYWEKHTNLYLVHGPHWYSDCPFVKSALFHKCRTEFGARHQLVEQATLPARGPSAHVSFWGKVRSKIYEKSQKTAYTDSGPFACETETKIAVVAEKDPIKLLSGELIMDIGGREVHVKVVEGRLVEIEGM